MKFTPITNQTYFFKGCSSCEANCCDGRKGSVFSQILVDEFFSIYENFPILFIMGDLGFVKPVVLLSNGFDLCPYNKDFSCTIYDKRPSVCKNYPLSPDIDNQIYLDLNCPAIDTEDGNLIIKEGKVQKEFYNKSFENYQDKYLDTYYTFEKYPKEDFEIVCTIHSINFYKYNKCSDNIYLQYHHKSLEHLSALL